MKSLPIYYDPALAAQGFPNPLVKATIAGHEAIFIVDSGAGAHILADWYVDAAGIGSTKNDLTVRGASGKAAAARLAHNLQGRLSDGQALYLRDAMVVTFPSYFKTFHIGGLVSPQLLAPAETAAVLDLRTPSLRFVPFARAVADLRLSSESPARPELNQLCRNSKTTLPNRLYLAPVTTMGVTEMVLIDTGATATNFSEGSRIAHAISGRSELGKPSEGVGGMVSSPHHS